MPRTEKQEALLSPTSVHFPSISADYLLCTRHWECRKKPSFVLKEQLSTGKQTVTQYYQLCDRRDHGDRATEAQGSFTQFGGSGKASSKTVCFIPIITYLFTKGITQMASAIQ